LRSSGQPLDPATRAFMECRRPRRTMPVCGRRGRDQRDGPAPGGSRAERPRGG
jgi:hypothetical protein